MNRLFDVIVSLVILSLGLSACNGISSQAKKMDGINLPTETPNQILAVNQPDITTTPLPTRPMYSPGELVDYTAQTGDTLANLAKRFNTTVDEIRTANSFIPADATTMPPGMPMKIPIYYQPLWGSQYQIIPDSLFINGPEQVEFVTAEFIAGYPGWINSYREYAFDGNRSGAEIINYVAMNFSVSPRLILALLEFQAGALSIPTMPEGLSQYPLGFEDWQHKGMYMQLVWVANLLNNAYYNYRSGSLTEFEHLDGTLERTDPWQNAASVSLQYYFSRLFSGEQYAHAIAQDGFADTYTDLYGDPWASVNPHIPGSLQQPPFTLPFLPGLTWAYTGGPHTGFGKGEPWAAIDFAPGAMTSGCVSTDEWATAVAPGVISRSDAGAVVLDLDGDGDERTGWAIFYFHIETRDRVSVGKTLQTGDPVGHPSCEGGRTTGTHVHIARKYNGEWIPADFIIPFNLDGWIVHNGPLEYEGTLTRGGRTVNACTCADASSQIYATK